MSTGFNTLYGFRNLHHCGFRQMEQSSRIILLFIWFSLHQNLPQSKDVERILRTEFHDESTNFSCQVYWNVFARTMHSTTVIRNDVSEQVCVCVYTVITNGFSSCHRSCTIQTKSRGQRYPCHFLCQRSWVTCGKDIDQGRLIYVPAMVFNC